MSQAGVVQAELYFALDFLRLEVGLCKHILLFLSENPPFVEIINPTFGTALFVLQL